MKPILFHLAAGCHVMLNDIPMTIRNVTHDNALLARRDTEQQLTLSRYELAGLASEGKLVFLGGPAAQPVLRDARPVEWESLDADKRARIAFRMAYTKALMRLDVRSPNNPLFRKAIEEVARRRGDDPAPSPRTVYRWVRNYRASGYDTDAFGREFAIKKGRSSRFPPEVLALISKKLMEKMSNAGATLSGVYEEIMEEVAEELGYSGFGKPGSAESEGLL